MKILITLLVLILTIASINAVCDGQNITEVGFNFVEI
jgi:hypothetical protein